MAVEDMERLVDTRLNQFREVPGLLEWRLPIEAAWLRLVGEGRPSTVEEIASVLGWPVEEVASRLADLGVEPDRDGRLDVLEAESEGVSMPVYRIRWLDTGDVGEVPGCACDALTPVLAAFRPARVELTCPATGRMISVQIGSAGEFEGVEPEGAVAVMEGLDSDWHPRDWTRKDCALGLLFASAEAASGWLSEHPDQVAVPMELFVRSGANLPARLLAEGRRLREGRDRDA